MCCQPHKRRNQAIRQQVAELDRTKSLYDPGSMARNDLEATLTRLRAEIVTNENAPSIEAPVATSEGVGVLRTPPAAPENTKELSY